MKKVLIIGKNSYIGKSFVSYVKHYEDNEAFHDENEHLHMDLTSASNGEWAQVDFSKYDVVLLLAGIVHQKETKENQQMYYEINYQMAVDIAKKAKKAGVSQMIFMSTQAVFGDDFTVITKDSIPQPKTEYGKTKLLAEQAIGELETKEFRVAIIRSPMVYGKECPGNFIRLVKLIEKIPVFPEVANQRSSIYIDNLCEFIRLLIISNRSGIFHPQNNEYMSTTNIVKIVNQIKQTHVVLIPHMKLFVHLGMTCSNSIRKMFSDHYYDSNLSNDFNLDYQRVTLEESIKLSL